MSLTALDADSLRLIADKIDFSDVCKLFTCGNTKLRTLLSRSVRSAFLDWKSHRFLPLADLILAFKCLLPTQEAFEMDFEDLRDQFLLDEAIPWNLFPTELKSLKLPFDLQEAPPAPLSALFPKLETLTLGTLRFDLPSPSSWLPQTLTSLSLVSDNDRKNPTLGELFSNLPPTLTYIYSGPDINFNGSAPNLTHLKHLEFAHFGGFYATELFGWDILPSSLTTLEGHFGTVMSTTGYSHPAFLRPPASWSKHFPKLISLHVRFESLCEYKLSGCFNYDFPPSFTSLYVYGFPPVPSWTAAVKFTTLLARRFGPRLRRLDGVYESFKLIKKYFYNLDELSTSFSCPYSQFDNEDVEHGELFHESSEYNGFGQTSFDDEEDEVEDELTTWRALKARQDEAMIFLSQRPLARTLYLRWLPDADKLALLPPNLTYLDILSLTSSIVTDHLITAPLYKLEDWPKSLASLALRFNEYPRDESKPIQPYFDFDCLPPTLQSLDVSVDLPKPNQEITIHTLLKGGLSHLVHLEKLEVSVKWQGATPSDNYYITSPLDLPASLTVINATHPFLAESVIMDAWDEERQQSRFDLKALTLETEYDEKDHPIGSVGFSTALIHRLPRHLTTLNLTCRSDSPPWDEHSFKALPRSLTRILFEGMFRIPFKDNDASCVQYMPKNLKHFRASCPSHPDQQNAYDHSQCVPKTMVEHFPGASYVSFPGYKRSTTFYNQVSAAYQSKHSALGTFPPH